MSGSDADAGVNAGPDGQRRQQRRNYTKVYQTPLPVTPRFDGHAATDTKTYDGSDVIDGSPTVFRSGGWRHRGASTGLPVEECPGSEGSTWRSTRPARSATVTTAALHTGLQDARVDPPQARRHPAVRRRRQSLPIHDAGAPLLVTIPSPPPPVASSGFLHASPTRVASSCAGRSPGRFRRDGSSQHGLYTADQPVRSNQYAHSNCLVIRSAASAIFRYWRR